MDANELKTRIDWLHDWLLVVMSACYEHCGIGMQEKALAELNRRLDALPPTQDPDKALFAAGAKAVYERWRETLPGYQTPDLGQDLRGERYGSLHVLTLEEFVERAWRAREGS